jgi:hypothetical protein
MNKEDRSRDRTSEEISASRRDTVIILRAVSKGQFDGKASPQ